MATFLVFVGIIAATVAVIYILVKLLMMFNGSDKDDKPGQDASSAAKAEAARK
ncbi:MULTISPECIES: hypothetical protein [unclassified Pigmentiphaga]|uniref:hypothetical protein n=1 Tax=unclassified Pigmentiphaga TaxID=2626614 RepID=UPI0014044464|nr:hypothetical protein [Pigmentiphaga sp. D-2]